jgi:hypothetical protein
MVYSMKTAMNTYKGPRSLSQHLLYLSTPRPEGSAGRVVVGIHSQVSWSYIPHGVLITNSGHPDKQRSEFVPTRKTRRGLL